MNDKSVSSGFYDSSDGTIKNFTTGNKTFTYEEAVELADGRSPMSGFFTGGDGEITNFDQLLNGIGGTSDVTKDYVDTQDNAILDKLKEDLKKYYNKEEVNELIENISTLDFEVVEALPTEEISKSTIYLMLKSEGDEGNIYNEYLYFNGEWEIIGDTRVDLSGYVKTEDLADVALSGNYNDLTDKPAIPDKTSQLTNDSGFAKTSDLADVALSGNYNDLDDKPDTIENANKLQGKTPNDFAPSGFGLGTNCQLLNSNWEDGFDLNNITDTGFFRGCKLINCPSNDNGKSSAAYGYPYELWWFIIHLNADTYKRQIAYVLNTDPKERFEYTRCCDNGNWSYWTRVNDGGNANKVGGKNASDFKGHTDFIYRWINGGNINDSKTEYHGFVFNCSGVPDGCGYGFLDVSKFDGEGFTPALNGVIRQIFTKWDDGMMYVRIFKNGSWTAWKFVGERSAIKKKWHLYLKTPLLGGDQYQRTMKLDGLENADKCIINVRANGELPCLIEAHIDKGDIVINAVRTNTGDFEVECSIFEFY